MFEGLEEKFDVESAMDVVVYGEPIDSPLVETGNPLQDDLETARNAIRNMIEIGTEAAGQLKRVADASETPRAFEVLGQLITTVTNSAKDLIALEKTRVEIKAKDGSLPARSGDVTNNNVFVGSTHELMQMLKEQKQLKEE